MEQNWKGMIIEDFEKKTKRDSTMLYTMAGFITEKALRL